MRKCLVYWKISPMTGKNFIREKFSSLWEKVLSLLQNFPSWQENFHGWLKKFFTIISQVEIWNDQFIIKLCYARTPCMCIVHLVLNLIFHFPWPHEWWVYPLDLTLHIFFQFYFSFYNFDWYDSGNGRNKFKLVERNKSVWNYYYSCEFETKIWSHIHLFAEFSHRIYSLSLLIVSISTSVDSQLISHLEFSLLNL